MQRAKDTGGSGKGNEQRNPLRVDETLERSEGDGVGARRKVHFVVRNIVPTGPVPLFAYIEALDSENYKVFTF